MTWSSSSDSADRGDEDRGRRRDDQARPSGIPSRAAWLVSGLGSDLLPVLGGAAGLVWSRGSVAVGLAAATVGLVTKPLIGRWFAGRQQVAQDTRQQYDAGGGSGAGALNRASATVAEVVNEIHKLHNDASAVTGELKGGRLALTAQLGGGASIPAQVQETYRANERAVHLLEDAQQAFHRAARGLARFLQRLL